MKTRAVLSHPTDATLALVPLTKGFFAVISIVDAEAVGRFNWYAKRKSTTVYALSRRAGSDGSRATLHDFIGRRAGLSGPEVDHRIANGLDCRRSNLRGATRAQQLRNTRIRSDNASGHKGVHWNTGKNAWEAQIRVDGRRLYLGRFSAKDAAVQAVMEARTLHHGDFANHGMA